MPEARLAVAEPFAEAGQQREAAFLGMWLFMATEMMLFGGLFLGLAVVRILHGEAAKEASQHLHLWIGGINTAVLLTSSMTMALAVAAARAGRGRAVVWLLCTTAVIGAAFLAIKGYEYRLEYGEGLMPGVGPPFPSAIRGFELFFNVYFAATALHALHLTIGIGIAAVVAVATSVGRLAFPQRQIVVEMAGIYWHFVDVVWVFLYPLLYLV